MTPFCAQLLCISIAALLAVWTLVDLLNGKIYRPGSWGLGFGGGYQYFSSQPIRFSIQAKFQLLLAVGICFARQIPKTNSSAEEPAYYAVMLALWVALSIISYVVASASQRAKNSQPSGTTGDDVQSTDSYSGLTKDEVRSIDNNWRLTNNEGLPIDNNSGFRFSFKFRFKQSHKDSTGAKVPGK
jgi:hypothetical protein